MEGNQLGVRASSREADVGVWRRVAGLGLLVLATAVTLAVLSSLSEAATDITFADGFESGTTSAWTSSTGIVVQSATVADGAFAAHAQMSGAAANVSKTLSATASELTVSLAVDVASLPTPSSVNFLKVRTATAKALAEVYVNTTGKLGLRDDVTAMSTTSPVVVTTGTWHTVSLHVVVAGTSSTYDVTWDGTAVAALTATADLGTEPIGRVQVGENLTGRTADLYYDSVSAGVPGATTSPSPTSTSSTTTSPTPTSSTTSSSPTATATTSPTSDPVLAAAGDIACDPLSSSFKSGQGTTNSCKQLAVSSAILADTAVSGVAALGDVQYYCGGLAAFDASYDPSWGRFKAVTHPAVGNHEYLTSGTNATDCDTTGTAQGYYTYFGSAAGTSGQGYYSYDLGTWHLVVLNTTCSKAGGCGSGSPQETWLRADLAAHPAQCTLAYWHIPLWSSGGRASSNSKVFTQDLYSAGADVVLTGHDHIYERFAPQDANGVATPDGIRAWVVGTGGANHTTISTIAPNSEVRDTTTFGYLRLTLHPGSYDWQFVPVVGSFTDRGSGSCH